MTITVERQWTITDSDGKRFVVSERYHNDGRYFKLADGGNAVEFDEEILQALTNCLGKL